MNARQSATTLSQQHCASHESILGLSAAHAPNQRPRRPSKRRLQETRHGSRLNATWQQINTTYSARGQMCLLLTTPEFALRKKKKEKKTGTQTQSRHELARETETGRDTAIQRSPTFLDISRPRPSQHQNLDLPTPHLNSSATTTITVTMMATMTAMIATPATHNEDGEDEHKSRRHVCLLECVCVCVCECVCMRVNKGVETWSVCGGLIVGSPIYELITNPLTLSQSLHSLTHKQSPSLTRSTNVHPVQVW